MNYSLSPTTQTVHLTAVTIDAGQIIALARQLDAGKCKGAVGDDNQGGWHGQPPKWKFLLTLPGEVVFKAIVVKLVGRQSDDFTLVAWPENPGNAVLPAFDREGGVYCKHMGSQLSDCAFEIGFRAVEDEAWVRCKSLDTALLRGLLSRQSREEVMQQADNACRQRRPMFDSSEQMEEAIRRSQDLRLQSYIDPASRVYFVCTGHVFRVDRSGPELVLVPAEGEK